MIPTQRPGPCPDWCTVRHGRHAGEDDLVHISKQVFVGNTLVRLCSTIDPESGAQDGPYLLVGNEELRLDEARNLIQVLIDLVAQGRRVTPRAAV